MMQLSVVIHADISDDDEQQVIKIIIIVVVIIIIIINKLLNLIRPFTVFLNHKRTNKNNRIKIDAI